MYKTSLFLLAISLQASDFSISEVMSNPQGSEYENEFIELYNLSDHALDISGWVLSDGNAIDTISYWMGPSEIEGLRYALILDPGYDITLDLYNITNLDSLAIYTISTDGSFGSGGLANSGEMVLVQSPDSSSVSQMSWTMSSDNGRSWERVSLGTSDTSAIWEQSLVENGTPGQVNSVSPPQLNLAVEQVLIRHSVVGDLVEVDVLLHNSGEDDISGYTIFIFQDDNQNGEAESSEWNLYKGYNTPIISQETSSINLQLFELEPGLHKVIFQVILEGDELASDDTLHIQIAGAYPDKAVAITEIMHSPYDEQGGEWIEVKNLSTSLLSFQDWTFSDANQTRHLITEHPHYVEPESLLTFARSADMIEYFSLETNQVIVLDSWPTLNSSSDSIRLFDPTGKAVAQAFYRGSWGESGRSLERRQPLSMQYESWNWQASLHGDGGTPATTNTRQLDTLSLQIESIEMVLSHPVGPTSGSLSISFSNWGLDTLRRLHFECGVVGEWLGVLSSFEVDSTVLEMIEVHPGMNNYTLRIYHDLQLLADTSLQVVAGFPEGQVALNEIHYLPATDQVEFLEFVNTSGRSLDLLGWSLYDRSGTNGQVGATLVVPKDSLFVLTSDLSVLHDWSPPGVFGAELNPWPSLNNSSDSIWIYDPSGIQQLAHGYRSSQGGEPGKSLERLALWQSPDDDLNWTTSLHAFGISPGQINSAWIPPHNLKLQEISIIDSISHEEEPFTFRCVVINAGIADVTSTRIHLQVFHQAEVIFEETSMLGNIASGDTLEWLSNLELGQCGWLDFVVEIDDVEDTGLEDNTLFLSQFLGCTSPSLIINEIMAVPAANQYEWIEVFNRSDKPVNLQNWQLSDNSLSGKVITDSSLVLEVGGFLVLSSQTELVECAGTCEIHQVWSFPSLNNSEDKVILYNPQAEIVDYVSYDQYTALVTGRSLERIRTGEPGSHSQNWGLSIAEEASTPGRENSLFLDILPGALDIILNPNPFTPNGDGQTDELVISYELPVEQGLLSIMIFDMAGRKIAEPLFAYPVSHRGKTSWAGDTRFGGMADTGLYIMKILIDDRSGRVYEVFKKVYLMR